MKVLVETTGDFMLMDTTGGQYVAPDRPSVVTNTSFIGGRVIQEFLTILGKVTDDATDEQFLEYFVESKGDSNLAVESFLSKFGIEAVTAKAKPEQKTK
jgi:hypothetical protein